jgi:NADPH:quinone reductase-like Zn-dependent oxidoreductase
MTSENKSVIAFNLSFLFDRSDLLQEAMSALSAWVETGQLQAPPVRTFPLAHVAETHRALESGETIGKLVLTTARLEGTRI